MGQETPASDVVTLDHQQTPDEPQAGYSGLFRSFFGIAEADKPDHQSSVDSTPRSYSPFVHVPSVVSYSPGLHVPEEEKTQEKNVDLPPKHTEVNFKLNIFFFKHPIPTGNGAQKRDNDGRRDGRIDLLEQRLDCR